MKLHSLNKRSLDELNITSQRCISMPCFPMKQSSEDSFCPCCRHLVFLGVFWSSFYSALCNEMVENWKSIMECRTGEVSAVNLEGSSSFWSWRCFSARSLLCPCMMFSAELKKETKQWLKWVRIKDRGTGKHNHGAGI